MQQIVTNQVDLDSLSEVFDGYIAGKVTGRTVVKVADA
jgi:hypothetical protein